METRRSARIRGRPPPSEPSAAPSPEPSPEPQAAAPASLPPQVLEQDLPFAAEESPLEAISRLPAFGKALLCAHGGNLGAAAQTVAYLERALAARLEPVWDELAEAAGRGSLGGAPMRLGADINLRSLKLPALRKLASALGLHATGAKPDLVARLGPVAAAVPAGIHLGIVSAIRPGFALALAAKADLAALAEDDSAELEARLCKSRAKEAYCLADEDLEGVPHDLARNPHYASAPPMQLFTVRSARAAGILKYGGRAGLEAARRAEKRGKRKAAEAAEADHWAEGEPARSEAADARRAAREQRLAVVAAKLAAARLQRLQGHPLVGRWGGSSQPEADLEALLLELLAAEALLTGVPLPPGVEHPGPEVLASARQGLAAFRATGRGRTLRHVLEVARRRVLRAAELAALSQEEAPQVLEEAGEDLERYQVMGLGSLTSILEAARSRLARRAREAEARAAIADNGPGFRTLAQPVLRQYVDHGGDLQALLAPIRAKVAREEEVRAATAGDSRKLCDLVRPHLQHYVEQGGDLQALLAQARAAEQAMVAREAEFWAAIGRDSPKFHAWVRPTLERYVERGGDLQALVEHARARFVREEAVQLVTVGESHALRAWLLQRYGEQGGNLQTLLAEARTRVKWNGDLQYPDSGSGWEAAIQAYARGGTPHCPVCNGTTKSGLVRGIMDHMKNRHPAVFREGPGPVTGAL